VWWGGAFVASWILLRVFIKKAALYGLVDIPKRRSVHTSPVPRGGGIVFGIVFFPFLWLIEPHFFTTHTSALIAMAMVYFVGIYDDFKEASPYIKFIVLGIAILLSIYGKVVIDQVGVYAGVELSLGWLAFPFTLFALAGFTNAFNLIDGLDALASSLGIVILSFLVWLGYRYNDAFLMHTALLLIVILAAFLVYNRPPAKVFMGDSGSLFVGFLIAVLSTFALDYISGVSILFLAAVPLLDTFFVMYRRKKEGKSMMQADKCHMHHILLRRFEGSVPKTVVALASFQFVLSWFGVSVVANLDGVWGFVLFGLLFFALWRYMQRLITRYGIECNV